MCDAAWVLFNQSRVFSTTGQAGEMLRFNNNSSTAHLKTEKREKERKLHRERDPVHSSSASASGCMVICNCQADKSHRGLSADVTGRNRCLIYCHICRAVRRHWSRRLSRGPQLRSLWATFTVCPIPHQQIKQMIRK